MRCLATGEGYFGIEQRGQKFNDTKLNFLNLNTVGKFCYAFHIVIVFDFTINCACVFVYVFSFSYINIFASTKMSKD